MEDYISIVIKGPFDMIEYRIDRDKIWFRHEDKYLSYYVFDEYMIIKLSYQVFDTLLITIVYRK
jgi:hypothetical protein